MAKTFSEMIELGSALPHFSVVDVLTGKILSEHDFSKNSGFLVMFICNHCPFVQHIFPKLVEVAHHAQKLGMEVIAINSNDVQNYPEDSPDKMKDLSNLLKMKFPYTYDEDQSAAKSFHAACTPDFFLYDKKMKLIYRGQFDDSRPGNGIEVTGKNLMEALERLKTGDAAIQEQRPSLGCNIKWKEPK